RRVLFRSRPTSGRRHRDRTQAPGAAAAPVHRRGGDSPVDPGRSGGAVVTRALLSLGSNLGDRVGQLRAAVAGLGEAVELVSGVYETPPWPPGHAAPNYLNAAVLVHDPARSAERPVG